MQYRWILIFFMIYNSAGTVLPRAEAVVLGRGLHSLTSLHLTEADPISPII